MTQSETAKEKIADILATVNRNGALDKKQKEFVFFEVEKLINYCLVVKENHYKMSTPSQVRQQLRDLQKAYKNLDVAERNLDPTVWVDIAMDSKMPTNIREKIIEVRTSSNPHENMAIFPSRTMANIVKNVLNSFTGVDLKLNPGPNNTILSINIDGMHRIYLNVVQKNPPISAISPFVNCIDILTQETSDSDAVSGHAVEARLKKIRHRRLEAGLSWN